MRSGLSLALLLAWSGLIPCPRAAAEADVPNVAVLRPAQETRMSNAGWAYDRYSDLEKLDAHKKMTVADLKGPGIIHCIHSTRHRPEELLSRGIVLEIYFDDAKEPAVHCPLADFFGDGCNGQSMDFSTKFIECAPFSYNAYFPMPFKTRAKVILRNDTDKNAMNYSFVEWEPLKKWDDKLGYFHATYRRECFQLTPKTDKEFFSVQGSGHLLGRQYSVVTDEPYFHHFMMVMEGNNEVDIDGQARRLDYLGTEDSFTFSWGFQKPFIGRYAGMTLVKPQGPAMLSVYRFHDYQPIRFNKSLRWSINWTKERLHTKRPGWLKAVADGNAWVDYATVYYWYQDQPGGFKHQAMRPVAQRSRPMLKPEKAEKPAAKESVEKK
ncbi:MAG: DUF2961 domain-containing protein [Pirellulales bacterium]|nr:DUF2961 domain-containing protein [Pirellulales bacterium]